MKKHTDFNLVQSGKGQSKKAEGGVRLCLAAITLYKSILLEYLIKWFTQIRYTIYIYPIYICTNVYSISGGGCVEHVQRRKYAQAFRRIELGTFGYPVSLIKQIHLTTKEGDDMSRKRFIKDLRKLIKWIRAKGYSVEYCGVVGKTPERGLLHFHGLLRVKGGFIKLYDGEVKDMKSWQGRDGKAHSKHRDANRAALGSKWDEIHGAFAVEFEGINRFKYIHAYIVKHVLKDYVRGGMEGHSFVVSGNWRRKGYCRLVNDIKEWWVNGTGFPWVDREGWKIINKVVRGWCEGKNSIVNMEWGKLIVKNGLVQSAEIYGYEGSN